MRQVQLAVSHAQAISAASSQLFRNETRDGQRQGLFSAGSRLFDKLSGNRVNDYLVEWRVVGEAHDVEAGTISAAGSPPISAQNPTKLGPVK
jgi:hypothetical protein